MVTPRTAAATKAMSTAYFVGKFEYRTVLYPYWSLEVHATWPQRAREVVNDRLQLAALFTQRLLGESKCTKQLLPSGCHRTRPDECSRCMQHLNESNVTQDQICVLFYQVTTRFLSAIKYNIASW